MIKLSLLIQDKGIEGLDLRGVEQCNPGLGGTEYLFVLLSHYLLKYADKVSLTVYHFNDNIYPDGVKTVRVNSEEEAFARANDNGGIFMLKNLQHKEIYDLFEKYNLKIVMWCHNFMTMDEMRFFSKSDSVKRVIAVGRQMYDYYVDDKIIDKMDYVFNIFSPLEDYVNRNQNYELNVTYVGSLIYQKSFHVLASCWKKVTEAVPDAHLNVIGTGKLYDRNAKLGKLAVAEASYEELFLENLRDENGDLLKSVTFHGLLGKEKEEIYKNTAVGVVNPLSSTETFCLCAVEMEAVGIPVVSRYKNGLVDTVMNDKTGILYKDIEALAESIIKLLKDRQLNDDYGKAAREFAMNEFCADKVMPEWIRVFKEIDENMKAVYRKPAGNFDNNGKRIRMFIHALHRVPFLKWLPSVHDIQKK